MRTALRAMGDPRAESLRAETRWRSTETRNEAVRTDSVVKQFSAGLIDTETAREQLGYSVEQIARMRDRDVEREARDPQDADGRARRGRRRGRAGARLPRGHRAAGGTDRPRPPRPAHGCPPRTPNRTTVDSDRRPRPTMPAETTGADGTQADPRRSPRRAPTPPAREGAHQARGGQRDRGSGTGQPNGSAIQARAREAASRRGTAPRTSEHQAAAGGRGRDALRSRSAPPSGWPRPSAAAASSRPSCGSNASAPRSSRSPDACPTSPRSCWHSSTGTRSSGPRTGRRRASSDSSRPSSRPIRSSLAPHPTSGAASAARRHQART